MSWDNWQKSILISAGLLFLIYIFLSWVGFPPKFFNHYLAYRSLEKPLGSHNNRSPFVKMREKWTCTYLLLVLSYMRQHTFVSPSAFSRKTVVSYWRKYVHEVLVNRLGGLSLPDMTLDVYRGRKTKIQKQQQQSYMTYKMWKSVAISVSLGEVTATLIYLKLHRRMYWLITRSQHNLPDKTGRHFDSLIRTKPGITLMPGQTKTCLRICRNCTY